MERPYNSGTSSDITMFVGNEVEHTPAYGLRTLFVVGVQPPIEILEFAKQHLVDHVYFGANMSFPYEPVRHDWTEWSEMIRVVLSNNYLCTLDLDSRHVAELIKTDLCTFENFIPMISVKLPYIQSLGKNAIIKLDDIDFNSTNPGIWCHHLNKLKKLECFTDWSKYSKDTIIK